VGISVQYRLYDAKKNVSVFDCVKDARSAVRYVRAHATELRIDSAEAHRQRGSAGDISRSRRRCLKNVNEERRGT